MVLVNLTASKVKGWKKRKQCSNLVLGCGEFPTLSFSAFLDNKHMRDYLFTKPKGTRVIDKMWKPTLNSCQSKKSFEGYHSSLKNKEDSMKEEYDDRQPQRGRYPEKTSKRYPHVRPLTAMGSGSDCKGRVFSAKYYSMKSKAKDELILMQMSKMLSTVRLTCQACLIPFHIV